MSESDLFLSPTLLDTAAAALDPSLKAPSDTSENPTFREGKAKGLGTWAEAFIIRDTSYGKPKEPKEGVDAVVAKMVLEVLGPADGGFSTNAGRIHYHNAYIDKKALNDSSNTMHGLNNRRIGVLRSLFSAVGLDLTEGISTEDTFNGDSNGKILVGQRVQGIVRKYKYTNKQSGQDVIACEIDGFQLLA